MKSDLPHKINLICDNVLKLSEIKKMFLWDFKQREILISYLQELKEILLYELEKNYNEK